MNKIYHMMPDGLMKTEGLEDVKDSLIMNVKSMSGIGVRTIKNVQSEKRIDTYKEFVEKDERKKKKSNKDADRMEQYYFNQ